MHYFHFHNDTIVYLVLQQILQVQSIHHIFSNKACLQINCKSSNAAFLIKWINLGVEEQLLNEQAKIFQENLQNRHALTY